MPTFLEVSAVKDLSRNDACARTMARDVAVVVVSPGFVGAVGINLLCDSLDAIRVKVSDVAPRILYRCEGWPDIGTFFFKHIVCVGAFVVLREDYVSVN